MTTQAEGYCAGVTRTDLELESVGAISGLNLENESCCYTYDRRVDIWITCVHLFIRVCQGQSNMIGRARLLG